MPEVLARVELAPSLAAELTGEEGSVAGWRLDGDPAAAGLRLVRLLQASFDDGRSLALVAARPRDAAAHGEESVTALIVAPGGEPEDAGEALLSTEYDADGIVRRAGVELWPRDGEHALRVAADREGAACEEAGRRSVPMAFRLDGIGGRGTYELVDLA
jgi:hypothetical protein